MSSQAGPVIEAMAHRRLAVTGRSALIVWGGLIGLTMLAIVLRRYRLAAHGLWFDEADLIARAQQSFGELVGAFTRAGENGPLYTLFMAGWLKLAGESELAVRLPSAVAGALAIPALIWLGRLLGGWSIGWLAGGLLAISPYAIWYSQDAKMYALLTLLVPVSWSLLLMALRHNRRYWWLAYLLVSAAGLAIHVSLGLVWLSQVLTILWCWPRLGTVRRAWTGANALLLVPLVLVAGWQLVLLVDGTRLGSWQTPVTLPEIIQIMAVKLAVNRADPATEFWGASIFAVLAGLGLLGWRRAAPTPLPPLRLLLAALLLPTLLFFLVTVRVPLFQDRYLIVILPAYLLLVAGGVVWLGRHWLPLAWLALVVLGWLAWNPLRDVVYAVEPQREDWQGAYRFIDAHAREGDIVLVHPGYLRTTASYYARRFDDLARLPIITLPEIGADGFGERELDIALVERTGGESGGGKTRVWLVTSPERLGAADILLQRWYEGNTLRFADHRFNGVRLQTFSYNGPFKAGLWRPEIPLAVDFGDELSLVGATWDLEPNHTVRAGDWALLTLRWRVQQVPAVDYVVRVRLRDEVGREVDRFDIQPLDGHLPTRRWNPRELAQVWDYHDLLIREDLPAGRYSVVVGLYPVGQPTAGLQPRQGGVAGDPLAVEVGQLTVIGPVRR